MRGIEEKEKLAQVHEAGRGGGNESKNNEIGRVNQEDRESESESV